MSLSRKRKFYIDSTWGYKWLYVENHEAFGSRWVRAHHIAWFNHTGTKVPRGYLLHHVDGDKLNNSIDNLELMSWSAHAAEHHTGAKRSEKTKAKIKESAKARCTEEWKKAVSERVKQQWKDGNLGRKAQHTHCIICGKEEHAGRGLCGKHFQRLKKYGSPYFIIYTSGKLLIRVN